MNCLAQKKYHAEQISIHRDHMSLSKIQNNINIHIYGNKIKENVPVGSLCHCKQNDNTTT